MKIVIVIPTYNEVDNITRLIPVLFDEFKKMPHHDFHILVVDGNSPDGTGQKVLEMQSSYPNLHLLPEEKKAGLGAAYICGFRHAMGKMQADVLVEMDADFQHDPKDIPRLIQAVEEGYDYVLGSRFIKGGSIPKEWSFQRKFLSFGGSMFTRVVLGIFNVHDFSTGFKASRVKGFVDKLDLDSVLSKGFAYKQDLLYRMYKQGAKIKEIPIAFALRDRGDSKMEKNNFMDSLKVVIKIRLRESQNFFRFIVVGFAGLFTDLGLFNILRTLVFSSGEPEISARYSSAISGLVAMTVTYILNNYWSFSDRKVTSITRLLRNAPLYYISSYIPILFRSWFTGYSVATFGNTFLVANTAFFIGVVIGLVWNFTVYSRIIWRKTK